MNVMNMMNMTTLIATPERLNLAFDLVILLALAGLWSLWWRTGRKQRAIEGLLVETAQEIDRASLSLYEAMQHIERLKQSESRASAPKRRQPRHDSDDQMSSAKPAATPLGPQITQLLRMHREGQSEEAIANALGLPSAQVKLLIKLHGGARK